MEDEEVTQQRRIRGKRSLTKAQKAEALQLHDGVNHTIASLADRYRVPRSVVARVIEDAA